MSKEEIAGIDYAKNKRHYDADDYVAITFTTGSQTFYVVGLMAYINAPTTIVAWITDATEPYKYGWCMFTHGQRAAPTWFPAAGAAVLLATLNATWPTAVPSFEVKDILFYATEDCLVRFGADDRVQHYIPANTYMRFHRRCFVFFVRGLTTSGTLYAWMEG